MAIAMAASAITNAVFIGAPDRTCWRTEPVHAGRAAPHRGARSIWLAFLAKGTRCRGSFGRHITRSRLQFRRHREVSIGTGNEPDSRGGIIYVDDVEPLVRMTSRMLHKLGYSAYGFSSAADALSFVAENGDAVSAIIADRSMPGMSGLELLESLDGVDKRPHFILATALHAPSQLAAYLRPGIAAVLAKPFTMEDLDDVLKRVLDAQPDGRSEPR
jgi:CheY-like chemotaxis protein